LTTKRRGTAARSTEVFAARYCQQNSHVFPSPDTAFVLAFSIIMLNTDLHNPAVKPERRMTKDGFRRNNRGISGGGDLDDAFLDAIFDRIQARISSCLCLSHICQ
jgi:brefeldin A-inhibited guanine nucleotide-exchange protein